MRFVKQGLKSGLAVVASVLFVGVASLLCEFVAGWFAPVPPPLEETGLVFPPGVEESFDNLEYRFTARINSIGLREREVSIEPDEAFRILAIGDSFTYGLGVAVEQTWVRQLETQLCAKGLNVETINGGRPGVGPIFYAKIAAHAIPLLKPDLVIVAMLQGNDIVDMNLGERLRFKTRQYYPNLLRLIYGNPEPMDFPPVVTAETNQRVHAAAAKDLIDGWTPDERRRYEQLEESVKEAFRDGRLNPYEIATSIRYPKNHVGPALFEAPRGAVAGTAAYLRRIREIAERHGSRTVVISVPLGPYVNRPAFESLPRVGYINQPEMLTSDRPDSVFRRAAEKAGLPFFTVMPAFRERKDTPGLYFPLDGHFTPKGHKLFADCIAPIVAKHILAHVVRQAAEQ